MASFTNFPLFKGEGAKDLNTSATGFFLFVCGSSILIFLLGDGSLDSEVRFGLQRYANLSEVRV